MIRVLTYRNLHLALILSAAVISAGCSSSAEYVPKTAKLTVPSEKISATAAASIAVSQSILEADWAKLDTLLDDQFTYTGDGFAFTKDQYIGFMQDMRSAFSNFDMTLDKIVSEGDFASIRFTSKTVNTGSFMGAPANRKNLTVTGIFIRKVKGIKVLQEWQTTDLLGVMNQIGFGAMMGYTIFVSGFNVEQKPPARKPNDFLQINGSVEAYDKMSVSEKNDYLDKYKSKLKK